MADYSSPFGKAGVGGTGTPYTSAAKALNRAQTLLGTTMTSVAGSDFPDSNNLTSTLISGTIGTTAARTDITGGVLRVATTAGVSHGSWVNPANGGSLVGNARTEKWYFAARIQLEDSVSVLSHEDLAVLFGANTPLNPSIRIGATNRTAADITHFTYSVIDHLNATTTSGSLGVNLDNAWHTLEMWNDLTNLNFGIDLGSSVTPSATTASTNIDTNVGMTWGIFAFQDASGSGAQRRISVDYIQVVTANQ